VGKMFSLGCFENQADALRRVEEEDAARKRTCSSGWRYWVEEIDPTGLFKVPPLTRPRDRFTARAIPYHETHGRTCRVEVLDGERVIAEYERNYAMLGTFEPFRQGDRYYALVSPHYTATSVMDLSSGEIIAVEQPDGHGFCPVGFYVADWWDVHDGSTLPGSMRWSSAYEWPTGDFGFVWGCVWGDDSSWNDTTDGPPSDVNPWAARCRQTKVCTTPSEALGLTPRRSFRGELQGAHPLHNADYLLRLSPAGENISAAHIPQFGTVASRRGVHEGNCRSGASLRRATRLYAGRTSGRRAHRTLTTSHSPFHLAMCR
jgi:hypothetical protein